MKDIALLTAGVITKRVIEDEKSGEKNGNEIVLLPPKAIQNGRIDHTLLQKETLLSGRDISKFLTRKGNIVLKLSSPYDREHSSKDKERYFCVDSICGIVLIATCHTERDGRIRLISARKAEKKLEALYNEWLKKCIR